DPDIESVVQEQIGQQRAHDSSNNRAKLPFEFASSINREGMKVRYGDGFGGAPQRIPLATRRVTTGAEISSDEQTQAPSSTPIGGDDHV
ncbi:MAG TPA: hypothetical protein PKD98_30145, partial [Anaerolineae bacterium]|nr:hypothetical protein [Anaerolineae bacterium]